MKRPVMDPELAAWDAGRFAPLPRAAIATRPETPPEVAAWERPEAAAEREAQADAVAADAPTEVPHRTKRKVHYKAKSDKWKRSTNPQLKLAGELIGKVLKGEIFTDVAELRDAGIAVARAARDLDGETSDGIKETLLGACGRFVSDVDELVELAVEQAKKPLARPERQSAVDGDFEVDPKTGNPVASQHNIDIALAKLNVVLTYDMLAEREMVSIDCAPAVPVDDHISLRLWLEIDAEYKFLPKREFFDSVLNDRAFLSKYHPVVDYLARVEPTWDGSPRLDTWLIRLTGAKDTRYVRAVSRLILVAACRRVRAPGSKFDEMLVLESIVQGLDKSTFVETLAVCEDWYTNRLPFNASVKEQMELTAGRWVVEAGELSGLSKTEYRAVKNYLSTKVDSSRLSYGRRRTDQRRQFVIIGTTNDKKYLNDLRNRRVWPIEIAQCDVAGLRAELDQLWAEAAVAESAGESIRLAPEIWAEAGVEQEERRQLDPIEIRLAPPLEDVEGLLAVEDAWRLAGLGDNPTKGETERVFDVMSGRLGWKLDRRRRGKGERAHCYVSKNAGPSQWLALSGTPGQYRVQVAPAVRPGAAHGPPAN